MRYLAHAGARGENGPAQSRTAPACDVAACPLRQAGAGVLSGRVPLPGEGFANHNEGSMAYTPYVLPHMGAALVSIVVVVLAWQRRRVPGVTTFLVLMAAIGWWATGNALELAATDLPTMLFWANTEYFAIVAIPLVWFVFALQYTGQGHLLTRTRILLLALVPVLTVVFVWTDPWHGLMRYNLHLVSQGAFRFIGKSYGP